MRLMMILLGALSLPMTFEASGAERPPNVILIFTDDQGYGDLACYGHPEIATPNLDRMAQQGMRFTDFYVAACVCTPSRAALLTGCHPVRVGLGHRVLFPYSATGLNPAETTLAEMLQGRGYATGCVGKWHLGHLPEFLPTRQGFDEYFGIPYSNDMGNHYYGRETFMAPPLPLMDAERVVESDPDQRLLTRRYTERAVAFIRKHRERPFFLYVAHSMPHLPIHASDRTFGKSAYGYYGDVIEEIDWSVGEMMAAVDEAGLGEDTLILFTSDNGPVVAPESRWGYRGGSAGPLRGNKNTTWEGGMREPFLARWTGRVPAGQVCGELATSMDLLPTLANLTRADLPAKVLDGRDITPLLLGEPGARTPHEVFPYYRDERLQAVRSGDWKLHVYRPEWEAQRRRGANPGPLLFHLGQDIGETRDVASSHPEVVKRLLALAEQTRKELGDAVTETKGTGVREVGRAEPGPESWSPEVLERMRPSDHREALVAALRAAPHVPNKRRDIVWAEVGGEPLTLDAFWPNGAGPYPMLVWIHGGGFRGGFKELGEYTCRELARRGFAVLNINYRLAPRHPFPAAVNDGLGAVAWARRHAAQFRGDPDWIAVGGESAGGNLAAMVAYAAGSGRFRPTGLAPGDPPPQVRAVVPVYGVFDLADGWEERKARLSGYVSTLEKARAASPVHFLRGDAPPTLLICGDQDPLLGQTTALGGRLQALGVSHEIHLAPGADHAFIVWDWQTPASQAACKKMGDWLESLWKK